MNQFIMVKVCWCQRQKKRRIFILSLVTFHLLVPIQDSWVGTFKQCSVFLKGINAVHPHCLSDFVTDYICD